MVMHHYHTRRRAEPYPASTFRMRVLDFSVYVAGVLGAFATIPQIIKIYSTHDAGGVSLLTWSMYTLFDIPWVIYAIVHKERPLVVCYSLWFFFNTTVVIGVLMFGGGQLGLL